MSRRDYVELATILSKCSPSVDIDTIIDTLCAIFAREHSSFSKLRFAEACAIYHKGRTE